MLEKLSWTPVDTRYRASLVLLTNTSHGATPTNVTSVLVVAGAHSRYTGPFQRLARSDFLRAPLTH